MTKKKNYSYWSKEDCFKIYDQYGGVYSCNGRVGKRKISNPVSKITVDAEKRLMSVDVIQGSVCVNSIV